MHLSENEVKRLLVGVLYSFCAELTSRRTPVVCSAEHTPVLLMEALGEFFNHYSLEGDDAPDFTWFNKYSQTGEESDDPDEPEQATLNLSSGLVSNEVGLDSGEVARVKEFICEGTLEPDGECVAEFVPIDNSRTPLMYHYDVSKKSLKDELRIDRTVSKAVLVDSRQEVQSTGSCDNNKIESAMNTLKEVFKEDPEYAFAWHSNIAMAFYDASGPVETNSESHVEHLRIGNEGASRFMKVCFGVETSQDMLKGS